MLFTATERVVLDYGHAGLPPLLANLSGLAATGGYLWTVSDEGRTVECLNREAGGYALARQVALDDIIQDIPDAGDIAELDLESIDAADGFLWLAGSHCRVRKKAKSQGELNSKLRDRPSRHLLAAIEIKNHGERLGKARCLPFSGKGSLRRALADDPYLAPFIDLPSKENGLDIEGLVIHRGQVLLGLRGPLIDSIAVVVRLALSDDFAVEDYALSFLDLGGLAIRELARIDHGILVLAGPVSDAPGPFRLYLWNPADGRAIQTPKLLFAWPDGREKPEGLCALTRGDRSGILVVYDRPDLASRVDGGRYEADWMMQGPE